MIYKMELSDSVDTMIFDLLEVPIEDKDVSGIASNTTIDGNVYSDYLWLKKQWTQKWSIMCQDEYNRLRGFWTRQFGNAEVPFYRLFYGKNRYIDKTGYTVNGFVQVNNDAVLYSPLSLTHLYGNAEQNGTPTPDAPIPVNVVSGAQTVKIAGKNLWGGLGGSYSRSTGNIDFQTNSDGTITASGVASSTVYSCNNSLASSNNIYATLKAGTYYLSTESTPPTGVSLRIGKLSDATTLAESPNSFTLTEDTDVYVSLRVASGTNISSGITVKPMVELGNLPSQYEPYQAQSYTIDLGSEELAKIGNYTDGIYPSDGKWYIHKEVGKVVLDGSKGGYNGVSEWFYIGYSNLGIGEGVLNGGVRSDYFTMDTLSHMNANPTIDGLIATSSTHIVLRNLACTSEATYKTWLNTHNTTVYYALATPTDTEITDADLIEQLNHIYSLYGGVNNLMLIPSAGAQGEIGVKYRLNYEEETDIVPKTPVVLTLSDGGVINACGCRQNIQLIMRETKGNSES